MTNYFFSGMWYLRQQRSLIDFVNLKIKSIQFFGGAHKDRVCVRVFIEMSTYTYMSIYIYNV
jgi:hypothetical protein